MGIETAIIATAAVAAAGTAYGAVQQNRAQKRAAGAQQDAADTAAAQQRNQEMEARRQQIRQQRIRTAQVQQAASNAGVSQSSGELGSLSALSTNVGANLANMAAQSRAAIGIGEANQSAANAIASGNNQAMYGQGVASLANLAGAGLSIYSASSQAAQQQPAPITNLNTYQ